MAVADAYATADEYRASNNRVSGAEDGELDEYLDLNSRRLDKILDLAPGYFNTHSATYTFDGPGGTMLWLRDRAGQGYCFTAITANSLAIDDSDDGNFDDYTWDLDDLWIRGLPENVVTTREAYTAVELMPKKDGAELSVWPTGPAKIQITGTFGWPVIPAAVRQAVIVFTRDMLDSHLGGATQRLFGSDGEEFLVSGETFMRFRRLAGLYGRELFI